MLKWDKKGQIFHIDKKCNLNWMQVQAQNPFAIDVSDEVFRVYFNTRPSKSINGKNISYPAFVEFEKLNFNIVRVSTDPLLDLGIKGDFDEFGIMCGSVIKIKELYYMYYVGWTRLISVPYNWAIGLATSIDGVSFKRYSKGPIIGPSYNEPFLQAGCSSIIKENDTYLLFYTSGIKWIECNGKYESVYQIMCASSVDGVNWHRSGLPIIKEVIIDEAQASPSVMYFNNRWNMVFSYRYSTDFRNGLRGYRLGYAWSIDLKNWNREDSYLNLDLSDSGWDSEMICYPHFFKINNKINIIYCGNDFGKKGFGIAELLNL